MKKINLVIVDDEPLAHKVLERHCDKIDYIKVVANCYDGASTINILNAKPIDAILLDIHMPELTGIELVESLESANAPKVIFTTSFTEYAFESFNYEFVIDYLHKPIKLSRFIKSMERLKKNLLLEQQLIANPTSVLSTETGNEFIYIKDGKTMTKINFVDLIYLQAYGNYIKYFLENGNIIVVRDTISNAVSFLPQDTFCRIHKSYIINLKAITKVVGNQVSLSKNTLPIGKNFREYFRQRITQS